ncbi:MAG: hypothetical protein EOM34_08375 [Clostridia bacterium]|nr:hypothetical protein [Lachnospiraceae bacterium]NCC00681.1 hypothetical protein [Clostridia bacterium]NCD02694.1 hypothetical protein [Clostridia bacterium]
MKGYFGNLFDFNGDGDLDLIEEAADFAAFKDMMDARMKAKQEAEKPISFKEDYEDDDFDEDDADEELDDYEEADRAAAEVAAEAAEIDLICSGLSREELEDMDFDERQDALLDAGLDPDAYDFW